MICTAALLVWMNQGSDITRAEELTLKAAPSRVDNPLKGLVPYQGNNPDRFPCSMEFNYIPVRSLVTGAGTYDWTALETLLNDVASRGHQTVFRLYLEYPTQPTGIPQYLLDGGLKVTRWNSNSASSDPAQGLGDNITPDYSDPNLRQCLRDLIAKLGAKYDGDSRIGYITMGLLGAWGEWHDWPRDELFASRAVQKEVMDSFQRAFRRTPILMRYPRGLDDSSGAPTSNRPFGYHDDSFAWATLDTGRKDQDWFFLSVMKKAKTLTKWMKVPIGGEIRPEIWGTCFDPKPDRAEAQDFETCVRQSHTTWLMDSGMFDPEKGQGTERIERAKQMVRLMGYDFHVNKVRFQQGAGNLIASVTIENRGVAPFYADWPLKLALVDQDGRPVATTTGELNLAAIMPAEKVDRYFAVDVSKWKGNQVTVLLGCPNPLKGGKSVGFANVTQDQTIKGWLTLGTRML